MCFFFFKQKTAYEMRISDWSSDVCSSDLADRSAQGRARDRQYDDRQGRARAQRAAARKRARRFQRQGIDRRSPPRPGGDDVRTRAGVGHQDERSEEHTSELQSLMRISYAVFCLKKKKTE